MTDLELQIRDAADMVLEHRFSNAKVVVGPLVYHPLKPEILVFSVASCNTEIGFFTVGFSFDSGADKGRDLLIDILKTQASIEIREADDELEFARIAENFWPCEKSHKLRAGIEEERNA